MIDTASNAAVATLAMGGGAPTPQEVDFVTVDAALGRLYVTRPGADAMSVLQIPKAFPPAAPQSLRLASAQGATATLAWAAPAWAGSSKVTGYVAVASPGGRSCKRKKPTCTITGLTPGPSYAFEVRATNRYGKGTPATLGPVSW